MALVEKGDPLTNLAPHCMKEPLSHSCSQKEIQVNELESIEEENREEGYEGLRRKVTVDRAQSRQEPNRTALEELDYPKVG